ncbi:MAG: methyltransferase domain-containing protein [Oligoflexus sp.]
MAEDRNFDELFDRFSRNIKQSDKGRMREILIRDDLQATVPGFQDGGLKVLDAGCGLGDMSVWLAEHGHKIVATDISQKMVEHTRHLAMQSGLTDQIQVYQQSVKSALESQQGFDLICIHAVLEWLAEPYAILQHIPASLRSGGYLSLTVYNVHRAVFSNLMRGHFNSVLDMSPGRYQKNSLTPPYPIEPGKIAVMLTDLGFSVDLHAGLRCFYDYLSPQLRAERRFEDIMVMERRFRHQSPYRDLARYVHFIARWGD